MQIVTQMFKNTAQNSPKHAISSENFFMGRGPPEPSLGGSHSSTPSRPSGSTSASRPQYSSQICACGHVFCPETVLRHGFSCLSLGSVSTLVRSCLGSVSSFHEWSCLMCHDCVLTVSLSGLGKFSFCVDNLKHCHFVLKVVQAHLLITVKRLLLWLLLFYGYNVS